MGGLVSWELPRGKRSGRPVRCGGVGLVSTVAGAVGGGPGLVEVPGSLNFRVGCACRVGCGVDFDGVWGLVCTNMVNLTRG